MSDDLARRLGAELTARGEIPEWVTAAGGVPSLTDPATAGVLLSLLPAGVRVAHLGGLGWEVTCGSCWGTGVTLGEAAARALLALWRDR